MKKIIVVIALFISSLLMAQSELAKYDGKDGIESITVTKKMFDLMSKVKVDAKDAEAQRYLNLLKKLDNLEAYSTAKPKLASDLNASAVTIAKANGLTQVASTTYEGNAVKVYGKSDASETNLKEVLITVNGNFNGYKTSVLSIKGDFPLSEIALIAEKLKLPVSDALNKLDKK